MNRRGLGPATERSGATGGELAREAAPQSISDLEKLLRDQMPKLSSGHRRIARQLLTDPEGCAFMTVSDMAASAGVNESTVVRFATKIGLAGYPALTALCRNYLREQAQTVSRFTRLRNLAAEYGTPDGSGHRDEVLYPLHATSAVDESNIVRTFARINRTDWADAVNACAESRAVYVMGMRKCYSVATLLSYLLGLVRDDVRQVASEAGTAPDMMRSLGSQDTFAAISIHRYTFQTVQAIRLAVRRGAFTIAFTDNPASPLAEHARVCFYVDTASVSVLRSMTAFVSLAQALVASVAVQRGTRSRSALLEEEDLLREFGIYAQGPDYVPDEQNADGR